MGDTGGVFEEARRVCGGDEEEGDCQEGWRVINPASLLTERQEDAFIPFIYGPGACVGWIVAEMGLALMVVTVAWRYEVESRQAGWETREGGLEEAGGVPGGDEEEELGARGVKDCMSLSSGRQGGRHGRGLEEASGVCSGDEDEGWGEEKGGGRGFVRRERV